MAISSSLASGFMEKHQAVLVRTAKIFGSAPREVGSFMLVAKNEVLGTIGGGQLEYIAIDKARQMLREKEKQPPKELQHEAIELDIPLGPEIGQCCGGRVVLSLQPVEKTIEQELLAELDLFKANLPQIYIMGAGHVGRALALALVPLPLKIIVIDVRKAELSLLPEHIDTRLCAIPEAEVRAAPPRSCFVIMTHDHGMDFMIAHEALARPDALYVGMIGSKSKRATFTSWLGKIGEDLGQAKNLICPIGGEKLDDKRPEIIAALVVAEILVHTGGPLTKTTNSSRQEKTKTSVVKASVVKTGGKKLLDADGVAKDGIKATAIISSPSVRGG